MRALTILILFPLTVMAAPLWAPCSSGAAVHYLIVRPSEDASFGADQEAFVALAKQTNAPYTIVTPDDVNVIPKDPRYQEPLHLALANVAELRRRHQIAKTEREKESWLAQKFRNLDEMKALQPDRAVAVRQAVTAAVKQIRDQQLEARIVLVYSGQGVRCADGKEWCAEVMPGQIIRESEWIKLTGAEGAIFDANFRTTGAMDLYAQGSSSRVYATTDAVWNLKESGKGLVSSALAQLMQAPAAQACLPDGNADGQITLAELGTFLSFSYGISQNRPGPPLAVKAEKDICLARTLQPKKCAAAATLVKLKFDSLFKRPHQLAPVQRAPSSVDFRRSLDKRD